MSFSPRVHDKPLERAGTENLQSSGGPLSLLTGQRLSSIPSPAHEKFRAVGKGELPKGVPIAGQEMNEKNGFGVDPKDRRLIQRR